MPTLEIRSPANVAIEYEVAPLTERAVAFLIDFAVVGVAVFLLLITVGRALIALIGEDYFLQLFLFSFVPMLMLLVYWAVAEYYFEGRTLGKHAMGLRTVRADGHSATFETYATRATMLMIDFVLSLGTLGMLSAAASERRQRTGDRIAQTVVVRSRMRRRYQLRDLLNIKTVEDHEVQYPAAGALDISQALALKELIVRCDRSPTEGVRALVTPTATRVAAAVGLEHPPQRQLEFLRQVLRDYIVLTR